jgi:excisionase family DNA binding protein
MNDLVKISQALKALPISRSTLIRLIQNGKIKGVKIGRNWFVYSYEIERIRSKGTENGA